MQLVQKIFFHREKKDFGQCIDFGITFSVIEELDDGTELVHWICPFYIHFHTGMHKHTWFRLRVLELFRRNVLPQCLRWEV